MSSRGYTAKPKDGKTGRGKRGQEQISDHNDNMMSSAMNTAGGSGGSGESAEDSEGGEDNSGKSSMTAASEEQELTNEHAALSNNSESGHIGSNTSSMSAGPTSSSSSAEERMLAHTAQIAEQGGMAAKGEEDVVGEWPESKRNNDSSCEEADDENDDEMAMAVRREMRQTRDELRAKYAVRAGDVKTAQRIQIKMTKRDEEIACLYAGYQATAARLARKQAVQEQMQAVRKAAAQDKTHAAPQQGTAAGQTNISATAAVKAHNNSYREESKGAGTSAATTAAVTKHTTAAVAKQTVALKKGVAVVAKRNPQLMRKMMEDVPSCNTYLKEGRGLARFLVESESI
jgi:hypothetical protein